jgi:uncharacterized protein (TIGR02266 family)
MLIEISLAAVADPIDAEGTERDDMAEETRKGKRAPAALRVRFRAGTVEEFIEQQSPNISSGGMFIKSKSPLARGTLMVFDFQLQNGAPLIKGVGRVVWARKPEAAGAEPPGMGIKFIRVEPESLPTFQKIMASKRTGDDSKDVVVRLGESEVLSPIPSPESKPTPVSEPSPSAIAQTKVGVGSARDEVELSDVPTPVPGEVPEAKAAAAKAPAAGVAPDLRATPRFDSVPTNLLRDSKRKQEAKGTELVPARKPASAAEQTREKPAPAVERTREKPAPAVVKTGEKPAPAVERTREKPAPAVEQTREKPGPAVVKTGEKPAPAVEQTREKPGPAAVKTGEKPAPAVEKEPAGELSRPIKVLGEKGAKAVEGDSSPLSRIFDSNPPGESGRDGARPQGGGPPRPR